MSVESTAPAPAGSIRSRIAAHPVTAFLLLAIPLAWLAQCLAIVLLQDVTPGLLVELLVLLGAAVLVTAATEGRTGVRRLFSGVVRWRVGAGWYVIALLALPVLTLLTAVVTGTLREPGSGWAATAGLYLLKAVVIGAVLGNIWEELAWAGVVQRRLMERKRRPRRLAPDRHSLRPDPFAPGLRGARIRGHAMGGRCPLVGSPLRLRPRGALPAGPGLRLHRREHPDFGTPARVDECVPKHGHSGLVAVHPGGGGADRGGRGLPRRQVQDHRPGQQRTCPAPAAYQAGRGPQTPSRGFGRPAAIAVFRPLAGADNLGESGCCHNSTPVPGQERPHMSEKLHLTPEDDFPEDLSTVEDKTFRSSTARSSASSITNMWPRANRIPETEFRHYDLDEEFSERDKRD